MWKDSIWLVKKEFKFQRIAFFFTFLAAILFAYLTNPFFETFAIRDHSNEFSLFSHFYLDLIFIGLVPSLSTLFMSGPYLSLKTIKEDPFGKRIGFYRALPIPVNTIALSRLLFMVQTLVIMSLTFYIVLTIGLSEQFFQYVTLEEWIIFILVWFGYSLAFGSLNTYIEFGTSGKMLYIMAGVFLVVFILIMILFHQVIGMSVVDCILFLIGRMKWMVAGLSIMVGILICIMFYFILMKRLLTRDYM
ncbi:hypothetical protein [Bacillus sp. JCM 19034]|uniref:hypothetical protein n=1 Tax=Bacillus sp. JCM 19034 TaxID=1481928 RepID=UPI000780997D|nr:hypothetical protein [Bacillus sp. JCM 19034]